MGGTFFINAPKFIEDEKPNWAKPVTYRRQSPKPLSKKADKVLTRAVIKLIKGKMLDAYEQRAMGRQWRRDEAIIREFNKGSL